MHAVKMGIGQLLRRNKKLVIMAVLVWAGHYVIRVLVNLSTKTSTYHLGNNKETVPGSALERIDWNNYSLMERDSTRTGLGEQGAEVKLDLNSEEAAQRQKLLDKYRHDAYLSDRVSLERTIGDLRPEACRNVTYIKDIPENSVSVIIPMFNEKNSSLLRSIHSIINRSPASLLKEVIVVDDFSQDEELKAPLDDYVREHFSNVKIVRNKQREGLIRSRIIGADASTGSFLVFLESHMEVNYNFLLPLLELVVLDYRTIACPIMHSIKKDLLIKNRVMNRFRGGFNWFLKYERMPMNIPMDDTSPHETPIMTGGALAISRKWWEELGKYDPGLEIWGAEQFELSVKSWLCGGRVVDSPCSLVAHVFRSLPYGDELKNVIGKNYVRFATVWMDEFREVVFDRKPELRNIDPGKDIFKQVELRKRLKCKPFDWFLTEVAPDILEHFPIVEPPPLATGHLILRSNSSLCASISGDDVYLANCSSKETSVFTYDWKFRIDDNKYHCFSAGHGTYFGNRECRSLMPAKWELFSWDPTGGHIVSYLSRLCLDSKPENLEMILTDCDVNKSSQSWTFEFYNSSRVIEEWDKFTNYTQ